MKDQSLANCGCGEDATQTMTMPGPFTELPLAPETRSREALDVLGVLGVGGMGVVYEAQQLSIERSVALKTLQEGDKEDRHVEQIVQEGWVMGLLEHPNIAPIYSLTSHRGSPAIVSKRIQGEEWATYLRTPELLRELLGVEDTLEWHLGVLLKVIDAIRFAHSRGILHRDLKPSNVMIGEFGEVYVMDWGLAVSTRPEHRGRLQLASEVYQSAGTYCYMAPEMLEPQRVGISELTDVYQLGGMLYEICMGEPPHYGDDWRELEESIKRSRPGFGECVPTELVVVCQRALRARPADRFGSADEFRMAILDYLRHRGATVLRAKGEDLLDELIEVVNLQGTADRSNVYQLVGPCRFAFQQALEVWPGDQEARQGLGRCLHLAAEYELDAGEPAQALALLGDGGDPELRNRCDTALSAKRAQDCAAEALRRRTSPHVDSASRRFAIAGIGAGWTLLPVVSQLFFSTATYQLQASSQFAFLSLWLLVGVRRECWVYSTEINMRSYTMVLAATILALVVKLGSLTMGVAASYAQVYDLFVFFAAGLLATFLIDWRMWPPAVAYLGAFVLSAGHPGYTLWAMAASNAVLAITAAAIWDDSPS